MLLQARRLSVQSDMQPVCHFLQSQGLSEQEVIEVGLDSLVLTHHSCPSRPSCLSMTITVSHLYLVLCRWFLNTPLFSATA